jgi:hypothetical protein
MSQSSMSRFCAVAQKSLYEENLAQRYEPCLTHLYQGLQSALSPFAASYQELQQGTGWLSAIAYIVEPVATLPMRGEQVAGQLRTYLDTVLRLPDAPPTLERFHLHLDQVSRSHNAPAKRGA